MNRVIFFSIALLFVSWAGQAQRKMSNEEYIRTYKELAVKHMNDYGIPASITLAQGILESGCGGSRLAVEGNNHFGIKCKGDWTGGKIYHDDDAKGECFRKYKSAEHSYRDHSKFLKESPRYAFLFELKTTDYKGWAHGLKSAGYATNPKYAELLIGIIEKNGLHDFDKPYQRGFANRKKNKQDIIDLIQHEIQKNNRVQYIITQEGDTFISIAREFKMNTKTLLRINDLKKAHELEPGTRIYLQPKRKKAELLSSHTVQMGESYHSIAQQYGIKLKNLYKLNPIAAKFPPQVGQVLRLK